MEFYRAGKLTEALDQVERGLRQAKTEFRTDYYFYKKGLVGSSDPLRKQGRGTGTGSLSSAPKRQTIRGISSPETTSETSRCEYLTTSEVETPFFCLPIPFDLQSDLRLSTNPKNDYKNDFRCYIF